MTIPSVSRTSRTFKVPDLSLVMPCYNEEECLNATASALAQAFHDEGIDLELVLVNNGSTDRTGRIIDELIADGLPVTKVQIENNVGYGDGILQGLDACRAPLMGYLCADGQVAPADVVRTYQLMEGRAERVMAKVRRRFRQDSWKRKIVSIVYNFMMLGLFGWLGAIDINGSPKIFSRKNFMAMRLRSTDWFLDPEIVLKAKLLGLRTIEIDVEGFARQGGTSNVKRQTILEFLANIFRYRFGSLLREWRRDVPVGQSRRVVEPVVPGPKPDSLATSTERRPGTDVGGLMSSVRIVRQSRHEDSRGFLQKILTASQCDGHPPGGEVYVSAAGPGEVKGNHFHHHMGEWFAVVQGEGSIELCDPGTGERQSIPLSLSHPRTVYVPPGLAHAIVNHGDQVLICVAWAESEHEPTDVHAYTVWPSPSAVPVTANTIRG
jgi:dTDP-4-dehydrorhamnose 3,5-epimerase-like enzyme